MATVGEVALDIQKGAKIYWKCLEGFLATVGEVALDIQKGAAIYWKCL